MAHIRLRRDVLLTEITQDCAARMLAWMRMEDIAESLSLSVEPSIERTTAWIGRAAQKEDMRAWAIEVTGVHVGNVVFDQIDRKVGSTRLSVYIGPPEFRGSGIGTTAIYSGLKNVFEELSLYKVWLTVHNENHVAIRSYTSLGFRIEGTLRGAFVWKSRRIDALYMGLLRSELPAIVQAAI